MRKYNFTDYYRKNLAKFTLERAEIFSFQKNIRNKPRPKKEWKIFYILTKERMKKWIKEYKFQKIGNRKYIIHL